MIETTRNHFDNVYTPGIIFLVLGDCWNKKYCLLKGESVFPRIKNIYTCWIKS